MFVLGTLIALITAIGVTRTVSTVTKDGYGQFLMRTV